MLARRILLAASLSLPLPACAPIDPLPPPAWPPPPGAPRLELRADGSYVKEGRVDRTRPLSALVNDHPEARAYALEYEHDSPIAYGLTISGLSITLTGMATVFPGLIAREDPVAVVGGVHLGVGLLVLMVARIFGGSARWERDHAIDLYNKSAAPPLLKPPSIPTF